jgi:hypothetical protein
MTGQSFVDGVIDDFINQMMQTPFGGISDIHSGPFSDGFESFKDFDVVGTIFSHFLTNL